MPRYYFHVYDDEIACDDEGIELPDQDAAIAEATSGARSLACEQVLKGRLKLHHCVVVADDSGSEFATIRFRDVVAVEG